MAYARLVGEHVTIFSLGATDLIGQMESAELQVEFKQEDVAAIKDAFEFNVVTGIGWSLSGDAFINAAAAAPLMDAALGTSTFQVAVEIEYGGFTYEGTGTLKSLGHSFNRFGIQKTKISLTGHGPLTHAETA